MDFARARTFSDLLAANLRFLRGDLPSSPYHPGGPPDEETAPLLAALEALHMQHGLLTFESQPGLCETEVLEAGEHGAACAGSHEEHEQRGYLLCWVEPGTLAGLLPRLRASTQVWYLLDVPGRPFCFEHNVPPDACWGSSPHLNLTRWRASSTATAAAAAAVAGMAPAPTTIATATPASLSSQPAARAGSQEQAPWTLFTNSPLEPGLADGELASWGAAHPHMARVLQQCVVLGVFAREHGSGTDVLAELLKGC